MPGAYAVLYNQCPRCEKRFRTKRDTKQHVRKCRQEGANRTIMKVGDIYPCQMCSAENTTLNRFKEHVFYKHHEDQI